MGTRLTRLAFCLPFPRTSTCTRPGGYPPLGFRLRSASPPTSDAEFRDYKPLKFVSSEAVNIFRTSTPLLPQPMATHPQDPRVEYVRVTPDVHATITRSVCRKTRPPSRTGAFSFSPAISYYSNSQTMTSHPPTRHTYSAYLRMLISKHPWVTSCSTASFDWTFLHFKGFN